MIVLAIAAGALVCPSRGFSEASDPAITAEPSVTFAHDIAPVLYDNCVNCHRDGGGGPFSLMTFKDAAKHATLLAQVTASKQMPPWKADANYGSFLNERHLTNQQIDLFARWADAGAPAGDLAAAPKPPVFTEDSNWTLGKPDLVVKVPQPFQVQADGPDVYRCFIVPLHLDADHYVSAVEFHPSNKRVVHHALFYLDRQGQAAKLEQQFHADHPDDHQIGYTHFGGPGFLPNGGLGGWAPGATPSFLPDDVGRPLLKGSDLVIQTHFHPTGKVETEQSTIGIYFMKKPPEHRLISLVLGSRAINIAPGDKNYVVTDDWTTPADMTLVGITPHAHLICKQMDVWATLPDSAGGKKLPLIRIDDWDFNWQGQYRYATPLKLPAGTTLHMRYVYDNSSDNVRNPNTPPKRVHIGEQTTDEMAYCFLEAYADLPMDGLVLRMSSLRHMRTGNTRARASNN